MAFNASQQNGKSGTERVFFASRFDQGGGEDTSEPRGRTKRAATGNNRERMSGMPTKPLVSLILPVRNEDDEFTQRVNAAGGKHYLCPAIRSVCCSRATLGRLARQYYQYTFWRIRTIQKHRRPAHLRQVIPLLFVLGWLALVAGAVLWRPLAFALAACAALYLLALTYGAVDAARRASPAVAPLVPVACAIMRFAHGLGSMHGIWSWVVLRGRFVAPPEFHKMSR